MRNFLCAAAVLAAAITVCPQAMAAQVVDQKDMHFSTTEVSVKAGESVEFTNSDMMTHDLSVTGPDGSVMSSHVMKPGDKTD